MLKKTIEYTDFNGDQQREDFFFHLSKAELVELEVSHPGGLAASLQSIVDANDGARIIAEFKRILLMAYGKKSEDGKRFIKNQSLRDEFESTEAYSTLFLELVTDADKASEFINGIIPTGLEDDMARIGAARAVAPLATPKEQTIVEGKNMTQSEAVDMDPDELKAKLAQGWTIRSDIPG